MNWKKWLKILVCGFLYYSKIITLFRCLYLKKGGVILAYHQISGSLLEKHIEYLKKHYSLISIDEFINHLLQKNLPPHSICLTFDDGYRTVFTENLPVLCKNKISAIVFLTVDMLNGIPWAWWEDLRLAIFLTKQKIIIFNQKRYLLKDQTQRVKVYQKILKYLKSLPEYQKKSEVNAIVNQLTFKPGCSASLFMNLHEVNQCIKKGMYVGSHTISHPILSEIDPKEWILEIKDSKEKLGQILNHQIKHFSYPNGTAHDFNSQIAEIVQKAGYHSAVTLLSGKNVPGTDLFKLRRIEVGDENGVPVLATKLVGLFW